MSNPIEPKFPKRRYNDFFRVEVVAPDGCYLLPAGTVLIADDLSWTRSGWSISRSSDVADRFAWTYARKLPDGQFNDDPLVQSAPEAEPLPGVDPRTQALAAAQRRVIAAEAENAALRKQVAEFESAMESSSYEREQATIRCRDAEATAAQLRDALNAVYRNCIQNHNKGIGAGPLAKARTALVAAGVDLKAPLQWEGAPEAEQQFSPTDPRTLARENLQAWGDIARAALERNTADAELRRKLFHESQVTALIREFVPALIEHRPDLRLVDAARQAAEMARIAMEKAAAFSAETSAPPPASRFSPEVIRRTRDALKDDAAGNRGCTMTDLDLACAMLDEMTKATPSNEPTTAVDDADERLDPELARRLFREDCRAALQSRPGAPVLRMTHDGKVTAIGAIEAPPGYYLLPAGEKMQSGDLRLKDTGSWVEIDSIAFVGNVTWATEQFCYARKLPVTDGPVS